MTKNPLIAKRYNHWHIVYGKFKGDRASSSPTSAPTVTFSSAPTPTDAFYIVNLPVTLSNDDVLTTLKEMQCILYYEASRTKLKSW